MGKKEALTSSEQSLREKFAQLRKKKQEQQTDGTQPVSNRSSATSETSQRSSSAQQRPLVLGADETKKSSGFKRPARFERKLESREKGDTTEPGSSPPSKRNKEDAAAMSHASSYSDFSLPRARDDERASTVFVGGLASSIDNDTLQEAFSKFGPIASVRIVNGKSYGFVKFLDQPACDRAVDEMNGMTVAGCMLRTSHAKPKRYGSDEAVSHTNAEKTVFEQLMDSRPIANYDDW